jgi:hypothetical protein
MQVTDKCRSCGQPITRECCDSDKGDMHPIQHKRNRSTGAQSEIVWRCRHCGRLWLQEYNCDPAAGSSCVWSLLEEGE